MRVHSRERLSADGFCALLIPMAVQIDMFVTNYVNPFKDGTCGVTQQFTIYTNPANNVATIMIPQIEKKVIVEIKNLARQMIQSQQTHGGHFDLSLKNFISGMYFVNVRTDSKKYTSKLLIK